MTMKKYNHQYTLAFSVDTNRHAEEHTNAHEIMAAVLKRITDIHENCEWDEAIGLPSDTYENEEVDTPQPFAEIDHSAAKEDRRNVSG